MKHAISIFVIIALFATNASAQECGRRYARVDQYRVIRIIKSVTPHITRLHELAILSNENDLTPGTQRAAMNAEYQAIVEHITTTGDSRHRVRRNRSQLFLERVIDSEFLELVGTGVDGEDKASATANAFEAARRANSALDKLWNCY